LPTRDLARISEKHLGRRYDCKKISHIVGRASTELEAWRRRSLRGRRYKFLYVDGANFLVRINGHVNRQSFCAVLGVSEENECLEVLALEMGASLFGDVAERGLNLEAVELGIMDGLPGLTAIFQRFFPRARKAQDCDRTLLLVTIRLCSCALRPTSQLQAIGRKGTGT
jgi:putative transposase